MDKSNEFESYLEALAGHETSKAESLLDARGRILVSAGVRLNWMGDFLANPSIEYEKKEVVLRDILFTGTEPDWNEVLLKQCDGSVETFQSLIASDIEMKEKFKAEASFGREPVLLVGPNEDGQYKSFDGMHRIVGAAIEGRDTITAFVAQNVEDHLPICEPHVVYDLIRGYQRNARDEAGKKDLYHGLSLLARTYANVIDLLQHRFGPDRLDEDDIQEVIQRVVSERKKRS